LAVQLSGVVRHRKEDAEELPVSDLQPVVDHFDRLLGMTARFA
jgi:hypothetical protein